MNTIYTSTKKALSAIVLTALFITGIITNAAAQFPAASYNFETTLPTTLQGWTNSGGGSMARTTSLPCSGVASVRVNTFTTGSVASFISPNLGASGGGLVT
ncbi:MAG: hypothetical protein ACK53R_02205, partial [Bacteroidota bacterium]